MSKLVQAWKDRLKGLYTRIFHQHLWQLREELNEHPERFETVTIDGEEYIRKKKSVG